MAIGFVVRKNQYYDSVFLMMVSKRLSDVEGVTQNAVLMATEANKKLLADIGVSAHEIDVAGPSDLICAIIAESEQTAQIVLDDLDSHLARGIEPSSTANAHSLEEGLDRLPHANLAMISVPGEYAGREATKALEAGLNVFLFSDNVAVDDEVRLKSLASENGLFVMGPDCGTALIGGVGIGFSNVVRRGTVGAIAASGTGLQEFTCLVHNAGGGISHGIGTGGRDLSDPVGGITTLSALDALESDPETKVITLISKPPGAATLRKISDRLKKSKKPLVVCFLGMDSSDREKSDLPGMVATVDEAAALAIELAGPGETNIPTSPRPALGPGPGKAPAVHKVRSQWSNEQKYLRGVFAGGTFCYQSQQVLRDVGLSCYSNAPLQEDLRLSDPQHSIKHTIVDMGADEFTSGRPHPMIDGTARAPRIVSESEDPAVAVLLLDFILGFNSTEEPVSDLLGAIDQARNNVRGRGGELTLVASVCGTDGDPQDSQRQVRLLDEAGVVVFGSNRDATRYCAELLTGD